jgi:ATP-dependent 26S proteasome regulatory subunit
MVCQGGSIGSKVSFSRKLRTRVTTRIQRHIKFLIPDASMRRELFALHLPNQGRVRADYAVLSELSKGISGGDILNICVNAIHAGSTDANPERWKVTQGMLKQYIT